IHKDKTEKQEKPERKIQTKDWSANSSTIRTLKLTQLKPIYICT
ncbi:TRDN isoform 7, partial [Pan troglodytes]